MAGCRERPPCRNDRKCRCDLKREKRSRQGCGMWRLILCGKYHTIKGKKQFWCFCFLCLTGWMIAFSGVYAKESGVDQWIKTVYNENNGLDTGEANVVLQTSDGYIWIGSYGGLLRYNGRDFENFSIGENAVGSSSIRALYEDESGRLLLGRMMLVFMCMRMGFSPVYPARMVRQDFIRFVLLYPIRRERYTWVRRLVWRRLYLRMRQKRLKRLGEILKRGLPRPAARWFPSMERRGGLSTI